MTSGGGPETGAMPNRVLFVTGRLAETPLRRLLSGAGLPFAWEVRALNITVAALMTTEWIANHMGASAGFDLVLIPGLVEGGLEPVREKAGARVEKGPKDLHGIPAHFGREATRDYGAWDIEIAAEINNAPRLEPGEVRRAAEEFRESGADIIDLGCTPGLEYPRLAADVRDLVRGGMRVSVDTFDPAEIRAAVGAGAELVLSVNGSNIEVARAIAGSGARVVAVPNLGEGIASLEATIEQLSKWEVPYLIDPILEPVGFGFMASLERYAEVRRRYPDAEMLMGIGNLTEMTAADSTGVNALLIAICQELGIRTVLTTEVIGWGRGAVREVDIARRLMYDAVKRHTPPKGIDDRLVTLKDREVMAFTPEELEELQASITDANFRIFADREGITVFNNERMVRGTDIGEIFARLDVDEATHAFYLGKELAQAHLAVTLGKTYRQGGSLDWGYLTPPDDAGPGHVRLTTRSGRTPPTRD